MATLSTLLQQLSQELEIPMPAPDTKGQYKIVFSDLEVSLYPLEPGIGMYSPVARCPPDGQEALFQQMMLANLFGQGTAGAVLGLTPDAKTLTLSQEIEYNIEYKDFRDILEDFLNAADFWHSEVERSEDVR